MKAGKTWHNSRGKNIFLISWVGEKTVAQRKFPIEKLKDRAIPSQQELAICLLVLRVVASWNFKKSLISYIFLHVWNLVSQ